jgi:hypothetical protein
LRSALDRLARNFKVGTLMVLRRIHDAGGSLPISLATPIRRGVGKRFARALVTSTLEGQTLYRKAFQLAGFSMTATFREFGHGLGID